MKKFAYVVLGLSIIGAVISGILLLNHYNPGTALSSLFCGGGPINPCTELSRSGHAELLGMPVAAFGLMFYLAVLFIILIADYAEERYHDYALAVLMPVVAISLLADIALGIVLISLKLACALCISSYGVNILMAATLAAWYRTASTRENWSLPALYKEIFFPDNPASDRKAFYAAFVLFLFFLPYAVFSTTAILKHGSDTYRVARDQIQTELRNFYQQPVQKIDFPESGIIVGNRKAPVSITVFTDFLCSFCYKFNLVEEYLLSKYKDKINIAYYHYPLDKDCNPHITKTIYKNSCTASRAVAAASEAGIQEAYLRQHFLNYQDLHSRYDQKRSLEVLGRLDKEELKGLDGRKFLELLHSAKIKRQLEAHIALANKLGVDGTPTIFIGGRKIDGYRPAEVLEAIVRHELAQVKPSE
jgi:protein-disulfide isomerase/uncharacterized membrane protein